MKQVSEKLRKLFEGWAKERAIEVSPVAQSGSYRKYFRIKAKEKSALGVFNPDKNENKAFISFTNHFTKKSLNVPKIYKQNLRDDIYLIEDLGDTTLYSIVEKEKKVGKLSTNTVDFYEEALAQLIRFQIDGGKGLDYSVCYPRAKFDKQSIFWDLNYFKYYFVKLLKIPFDEQKLEDDFNQFAKMLLSADSKYFMCRDFQSRNILVKDDQLFFIDYQGGRKGPLQYDVASLLFQAKLNLSPQFRNELLEFYLGELSQTLKIKRQSFLKHYYDFVLIRLLQTLGAYGFRGHYENKSHFLLSIPYAVNNLKWLRDNNKLPKKLSELYSVLNAIISNEEIKKFAQHSAGKKLKVTINSFSYKEGIPKDYSGNGGGFVFDCRALHNPGRYEKYKALTGLDKDVINFLKDRDEVNEFLRNIYSIVDESVKNYSKRKFENLMINFGCTGGQHRSVYCAENLTNHIKEKFNVSVEVNHAQLSKKV